MDTVEDMVEVVKRTQGYVVHLVNLFTYGARKGGVTVNFDNGRILIHNGRATTDMDLLRTLRTFFDDASVEIPHAVSHFPPSACTNMAQGIRGMWFGKDRSEPLDTSTAL